MFGKKVNKEKLKGGLNLYQLKYKGVSTIVSVLAESFEDALEIYRKNYAAEPLSITRVQSKIEILTRD